VILVVAIVVLYAVALWPLSVAAVGTAIGRPPEVVRIGTAPVLTAFALGRVRVEVGLPLGAMASWGERLPPTFLGLGTHGAWALLFGALGAAVDPVALGAAWRFLAATVLFRDTGVGGLVGGWSAASPYAAAHPLGSVLAGCAAVAVFNVVIEALRVVGRSAGVGFLMFTLLMPLAWLVWLVWLDL
jgi:hypothetical protein